MEPSFHPCQCITFNRLSKKEIKGIFEFHFVLSTLWKILGTADFTLPSYIPCIKSVLFCHQKKYLFENIRATGK